MLTDPDGSGLVLGELASISMSDVPGQLQDFFGDSVVAVETRSVEVDESLLWLDERASLGKVVDGRWWDWVMGRRCARLAIEQLGVEPAPILTGDKRQPLWPTGIVGAITHTNGYAAAAVARADERFAVGVDSEPDEPLPEGVLRRVSLPEEREWMDSDQDFGVTNVDRLLFSAKESIYKAWYPLAAAWLGFDDARLTLDPTTRTFVAEILVDGPLSVVGGRYGSVGGIILTAVEVPRD